MTRLGMLLSCAIITAVASFQNSAYVVTAERTPSKTALSIATTAPRIPLLEPPTAPSKRETSSRNKNFLSNLFQKKKKNNTDAIYQTRKEEWARKYTSLQGLRDTFGSNRNGIWGDLDAATTRRLYKTLLPKALLELYNLGVEPEELAPLAYRARVAAKLYARERCELPARVAANLYDGFRQWRKYGSFDTAGMTYDQIWNKYANVILEECQSAQDEDDEDLDLSPQDVTAKICLKILERSCTTNEMVDKLVLKNNHNATKHKKEDLDQVTRTIQQDVHRLLVPHGGAQKHNTISTQRYRMLKAIAKSKKQVQTVRQRDDDTEQFLDSVSDYKPWKHRHVGPWQHRTRPSRRRP